MAKQKEKITYIDDGRSLADMSGIPGKGRAPGTPRSSLKEQLATFWAAMKMMFLPTLVAAGGILLVYLVLWLIFWLM